MASDDRTFCSCGEYRFGPAVIAVLVFQAMHPNGFPILPAARYRICSLCDGPRLFVDRAVASNPKTADGGEWEAVVICFHDRSAQPWKLERKQERIEKSTLN